MANIYTAVDELIGHTPLLRLTNLEKKLGLKARLLAKLECFNPAGSAKDRVAKSMILEAEQTGVLKEGSVIIEPTSGNTGIGLASVAASRGYRAIIVMPDTMSIERQLLMKVYGAEVILSDGTKGMSGAIAKAEEMAKEIAVLEEKTTAEDFWGDLANSQKVLQRIASLKNKIKAYEDLKTAFEDALVMIELSDEEGDLDLLPECQASVEAVEAELEKQTLATLLSGEYDNNNALVKIHSGAGGTEACDWAGMLQRMYQMFATKNNFKVSILDTIDGDGAGVKSVTLRVDGENA